MYMSEESYRLVATQEENAIAAQDQAEAMWKDCEAALVEHEGLKLDMMDIKLRAVNVFDRAVQEGTIGMEETSQVMIKILFGMLVERREDGKESISPEQLDSVWDLLPLMVKFRLPELSAMSLLHFDNLEDLYYRLGGKANSRITSFLLPQVYRLGKAGDDRILENLGKACHLTKEWEVMGPTEQAHNVSLQLVQWLWEQLETILRSMTTVRS